MPLDVLVLYNAPTLEASHPDYASEAGVLDSVEGVSEALLVMGHSVERLGIRSLDDLLDARHRITAADVVFNLFEGFAGVGQGEAVVAGLVESLGPGLTGSGPACLDLVRDKPRTKWLLRGAGLPTPEFVAIAPNRPLPLEELQRLLTLGPAIVKPAHEDASLGIGPHSVISEMEELRVQVDLVAARYGVVLVERFIAGREFNVAVVALPEPRLLPLAEIEFAPSRLRAERIVSYEAKWATDSPDDLATRPRCPANVDANLAQHLGEIALAAFKASGCRDYARVDLRLDEAGQGYLLEVNGNPDIGPVAGFARALSVAGIGYADFVERVACQASQRRRSTIRSEKNPSG